MKTVTFHQTDIVSGIIETDLGQTAIEKNKEQPKERQKRVPCEIYSRVVGYFRPLNQWNPGKKEEFKDRKEFTITEEILKKEVKKDGKRDRTG